MYRCVVCTGVHVYMCEYMCVGGRVSIHMVMRVHTCVLGICNAFMMCACAYLHMCTCVCMYMHRCICTCICMHMRVCVYVFCISERVFEHVCVCVHEHVHACVYICMCDVCVLCTCQQAINDPGDIPVNRVSHIFEPGDVHCIYM